MTPLGRPAGQTPRPSPEPSLQGSCLPPPEIPPGRQGPEPQGPVAEAERAPGEEHVASGEQAGKPPLNFPGLGPIWGSWEAAWPSRPLQGWTRPAGHRTASRGESVRGGEQQAPLGETTWVGWQGAQSARGRGSGQMGWPPGAHTQGLPKVTRHEEPRDGLWPVGENFLEGGSPEVWGRPPASAWRSSSVRPQAVGRRSGVGTGPLLAPSTHVGPGQASRDPHPCP